MCPLFQSFDGIPVLPPRHSIFPCHGQTVLDFDTRVLKIFKILLPKVTLMQLPDVRYAPDVSRLAP